VIVSDPQPGMETENRDTGAMDPLDVLASDRILQKMIGRYKE
jgi:hypothetical protein